MTSRLRDDGVFEVEIGGVDPWPERVSDGILMACALCGRHSAVDYVVDDNLWIAVVPTELQRDFVCIECFNNLANRSGITDWVRHLKEVQVCSEAATTVMHPNLVVIY